MSCHRRSPSGGFEQVQIGQVGDQAVTCHRGGSRAAARRTPWYSATWPLSRAAGGGNGDVATLAWTWATDTITGFSLETATMTRSTDALDSRSPEGDRLGSSPCGGRARRTATYRGCWGVPQHAATAAAERWRSARCVPPCQSGVPPWLCRGKGPMRCSVMRSRLASSGSGTLMSSSGSTWRSRPRSRRMRDRLPWSTTRPRANFVSQPWRSRAAAYTVLGWIVADLEGEIDRPAVAGVTFNRYDGMAQDDRGIWTAPDGARVAWFRTSTATPSSCSPDRRTAGAPPRPRRPRPSRHGLLGPGALPPSSGARWRSARPRGRTASAKPASAARGVRCANG